MTFYKTKKAAPEKSEYVLNEPYRTVDKHAKDTPPITLDSDEYFVLGDNRDASADSRVWGPLQARFILGRPIVRLFPFNEIQRLPGVYRFPELE